MTYHRDILSFSPKLPGKTFMYCDPPWTQGILTSFYHRAGLDEVPTLLELFKALVREANRCEGGCIEMGAQHAHALASMVSGNVLPITYAGGRRPARIIYFGRYEWPELAGMDDRDTPFLVAERVREKVIYDPCCGNGLTKKAALAAGKQFVGVELQRVKAERTRAL